MPEPILLKLLRKHWGCPAWVYVEPDRGWLRIAESCPELIELEDGTCMEVRDAREFVIARPTGELLESQGSLESLPDGVVTAEMLGPPAIAMIREAFEDVPYPGDNRLVEGYRDDEVVAIEKQFRRLHNWTAMKNPEFLDGAPDGLASALCFMTPAARHYYLPAYLILDIEGKLGRAEPYFRLTMGFSESGACGCYEEEFRAYTPAQARAIIAYLRWMGCDGVSYDETQRAIEVFWLARAEANTEGA
ncbi:MAG: hypothetical protein AMXMBFR47_44830 [Planctomycetota bacterium]